MWVPIVLADLRCAVHGSAGPKDKLHLVTEDTGTMRAGPGCSSILKLSIAVVGGAASEKV